MCIPTRRRAKHYCSDEKRRNNVKKKKGRRNNYCTKVVRFSLLHFLSFKGRQTASCLSSAKRTTKATTRTPHLLTAQELCPRESDKTMPPRPSNVHKLTQAARSLLTNALPHLRSAHALQSAGELGVLLLDLKLCASRLGVREGVDDLALGAGELGGTLEVLEGVGDLALLQEELGHRGDGDVAFGVDCGTWLVQNTFENTCDRTY
jgi:hypothetical protein